MIFVNFYILFVGLFKLKVYCEETHSIEDESIILRHLFKRDVDEPIPLTQTNQVEYGTRVHASNSNPVYRQYSPSSTNEPRPRLQYNSDGTIYYPTNSGGDDSLYTQTHNNPSSSTGYQQIPHTNAQNRSRTRYNQPSNNGAYYPSQTHARQPTGRRYPNAVSYPLGPIVSTNNRPTVSNRRRQYPTGTGRGGQTIYQPRPNPGSVQPTYTRQGGTYAYNPSAPFGCQETGIRIRINGMECARAIDHYGAFLCYRHEFTSRECCEKCRQLKNPAKIGCEYGDHSYQCRQIQPFDCYDLRNRQSCCDTCEQHRRGDENCEYGDMTPRCQRVAQNPSLCYIPENQRLCCNTCRRVSNNNNPECPWGDQNSELCRPFDQFGGVRINCYSDTVRRLCCQTCLRLQQRMPNDLPGNCQYGDRPVIFNTNQFGSLNCTSFFRHFPVNQCTLNQAVAINCCYTCYRYTRSAG